MKNLRIFRHFVVLLSAVIFSGIVTSASAQPAETSALEWRQIPIKDIRPSMLAYWIDPAHHAKPVEYQKAQGYLSQSLSPKQMTASPKTIPLSTSALKLPAGVATIFADDENKVIWVRSTPAGFDQLQKKVEFLDRPIRKIDFDFKMIEIDSPVAALTQDNPSLKSIFEASAKGARVYLSPTLQSTLDNLIKNGDAEIIKSSQFTILNNLTHKYTTATSTPVTLDIKHADGGNQILTTQNDKDSPLFLENRLSVIFTPTLNNDDTITIFMTIAANAELTHQTPLAMDDLLWVRSLDNAKRFTTVFTIHNSDPMLLTGYNSTMLGIDNQNHPIVISVKAQIEK